MDCKFRYKHQMAKAATKGLAAAMALKRLRMTTPSTARPLFTATIAPIMDYALNIWEHACTQPAMTAFNRVQKVGAQAITGAFRTVLTAVAEAEASIHTIIERHTHKITNWFIELQTLPAKNPLTALPTNAFQRFISPL